MRYRLALFLVLIASTASAEERCLARETPRQCLRRLVAARAFVNAQADLDAATTGPNDASSPAHSAVKDFNSVLTAHVDAATPSDSGKALTVDYNFPGAFLGARQQLNLQVVLTDPSLSPAVKTELAADTTRLTALQQSLGRGDDVAATLTFNRVTPWFGRSLEPHRALLESILLGLVADSAPAGAITAEKLDTPFDQILPDAAARIPAMMDFETAAAAALPAKTSGSSCRPSCQTGTTESATRAPV